MGIQLLLLISIACSYSHTFHEYGVYVIFELYGVSANTLTHINFNMHSLPLRLHEQCDIISAWVKPQGDPRSVVHHVL